MRAVLLGCALFLAAGCRERPPSTPAPESSRTRLVFKLQPLGGAQGAFEQILNRFRSAHPEIELRTELLPNNSDVAHQYFLTALEGGAQDFDLFVADVVWVPELARAGWAADLSEDFPPEQLRRDFLPGPAEAVTWHGRTWAVPWYVDVGLLYYRTDLVPRAPRTYAELEQLAREATRQHPGVAGYLFQGKQYEGLVCVVYEAIWGHGGEAQQGDRLVLDDAPAREALAYLHRLVSTGVSPASVTSGAEEETRRVFQQGGAAMMRNWPYAWELAQAPDSPIRGKIDVAPLPTSDGEPGWGTLGGWQLAVNAAAPPERRAAAVKLIAFLTSQEVTVELALKFGRNPPRMAAYDDPELRARVPFVSRLREILTRARPRPVTPYYSLLSDVLQSEFSAALAGVRSPEAALERAQKRVDQITGAEK